MFPDRPHVLGIDDAPFDKRQAADVPLIGVMMEGANLVEAVATTRFPVDGEHATRFLADWIEGLRFRDALQAVLLGGITIAGLGLVDVRALAGRLALPVIAVTRRDTATSTLAEALHAAGLSHRLPVLDAAPPSVRLGPGLHASFAGAGLEEVQHLIRTTTRKARLPEPLRLAHLVGAAWVRGESRGRV